VWHTNPFTDSHGDIHSHSDLDGYSYGDIKCDSDTDANSYGDSDPVVHTWG